MARTVASGFEGFRARLEITELQQATIATRQKAVRDTVSSEFTLTSDFLMGSYARETLIRPPSDIDLFVVLDYRVHMDFWDRPDISGLMRRMQKCIKSTYPQTEARPDGQAVVVRFSDFGFDIVPGYGNNERGYWIPSPSGSWMRSDPEYHAKLMTSVNQRCGGRFKPLVKMVKYWNRARCGDFFKSFHLEVMAANAFSQRPFTTYPAGLVAFFTSAAAQVRDGVVDPAGLSGRLDAYLDDGFFKRSRGANAMREAAGEATRASNTSNEPWAYGMWLKLFKDGFPAYG